MFHVSETETIFGLVSPLGPFAPILFCLLYIAYATKYIDCSVRLDSCFVAGFSDGINVALSSFIF